MTAADDGHQVVDILQIDGGASDIGGYTLADPEIEEALRVTIMSGPLA